MECVICQYPLTGAPFEDESIEDTSAKVTICGHVFHSFCWTKAADSPGSRVGVAQRCAVCKRPNFPDGDLRDIFFGNEGNSNAQEVLELTEKNIQLCQEIENLKLELATLKKTRIRDQPGNPRWHIGIMEDAKCFNCESKTHRTQDCEFEAIIRNVDFTPYAKWGEVKKYEYFLKIEGDKAGQIVSFFEKKLCMEFSRKEIQCVFAFVFFDKICWACASPFHCHPECGKSSDPSVKKVCKLMHLLNHPLSDEGSKKR